MSKPWPKIGAAHYHTQLGLPDKGHAIKVLVVCYVVCLGSIGWVFGQAQGAWSGPLLWSGWLSGSSTATPHRFIQIHMTHTLVVSPQRVV